MNIGSRVLFKQKNHLVTSEKCKESFQNMKVVHVLLKEDNFKRRFSLVSNAFILFTRCHYSEKFFYENQIYFINVVLTLI